MLLIALCVVAVFAKWGSYWLQAFMSDADVSMKSLIVMSFLRIEHRLIVTAKVMGRQAGLNIDRQQGMSTARLEAHFLAGGNVMNFSLEDLSGEGSLEDQIKEKLKEMGVEADNLQMGEMGLLTADLSLDEIVSQL